MEEYFVCQNDAVLKLSYDLLATSSLSIFNDELYPADILFLVLPKSPEEDGFTHWRSECQLSGAKADLVIVILSNTHIHNAGFTYKNKEGQLSKLNNVVITDNQIIEESNDHLNFDLNANNNAKLIVDNLKANQAYLTAGTISINGSRIESDLSINIHNPKLPLKISGQTTDQRFYLNNLNLDSSVGDLILSNGFIVGGFKTKHITDLQINKVTFGEVNWQLLDVDKVSKLSLQNLAQESYITANSLTISSLIHNRGKFHISAKSYINFISEPGDYLKGIELVLDMSDSKIAEKKIFFNSSSLNLSKLAITGASDVKIMGGSCNTINFHDCKVVDVHSIGAKTVKYIIENKPGKFYFGGKVAEDLLIIGRVDVSFQALEVNNLEASGLCQIIFRSSTKCQILKLNLDLDASNPGGLIQAGQSGITISNGSNQTVEITTLLAKLSTFYVKGNTKLGQVLIQPIDNLHTLLWVDFFNGKFDLKIDSLMVTPKYEIIVSRDGSGNIFFRNRELNSLSNGEIHASISGIGENYIYVQANKGIRFDGKLEIIKGDFGLFSNKGNIHVQGDHKTNNMMLSAPKGFVAVSGQLQAKSLITMQSGIGNFFDHEAKVEAAANLISYTLGTHFQGKGTELTAKKIVVVARNIALLNSNVRAKTVIWQSNSTIIADSVINTGSLFNNSITDFVLINSAIRLEQQNYVLFANSLNNPNGSQSSINSYHGGLRLPQDIILIGMFTKDHSQMLAQVKWQEVDFQTTKLESGSAYINAGNGCIAGSKINASAKIIIKTKHSLQVVPLALHNAVMVRGGYTKQVGQEIVSNINAGLIDIEAGEAAIFVGAMLKAYTGSIDAEVIRLLDNQELIKTRQTVVKEIQYWTKSHSFFPRAKLKTKLVEVEEEQINVGHYFNFSQATYIRQNIANFTVNDHYASKDLHFTQISGDITINRSIKGYQKLSVNAEAGKIIVTSDHLQEIYRGAGGKDHGASVAHNNRTSIIADKVYLAADEVEFRAGQIIASKSVKIIGKNGVFLLPVSVHERLEYHHGRSKIDETIVRQIISEINTGLLEVKSGGVLEAVSTLIKATGVKIEAKELILSAERDVFEKNINFRGKKQLFGGSNRSHDYTKDEYIVPTIIQADNFTALIDQDTTIRAANFLIKQDNIMKVGGNIKLYPEHNIHIHHHNESKARLFNFSRGHLTIGGYKQISSHYTGQDLAPTIYHCGGKFFGYSGGYIHLLGAKIIADDIYLAAPKGIKLEAASYTRENFIHITEAGYRMGFVGNSSEVSVKAEVFINSEEYAQRERLREPTELMARGELVIESEQGNLEVISSSLKFARGLIKVQGLKITTVSDEIEAEQRNIEASVGVRAGIQISLPKTIKNVGELINKTGTHWLDVVDRGLKAYGLYGEFSKIVQDAGSISRMSAGRNLSQAGNLHSVQYGVWARGELYESYRSQSSSYAVDNVIEGGELDVQVNGAAVIEGIICNLESFKLRAASFNARASHDLSHTQHYTSSMGLTVPIYGNVGESLELAHQKGQGSGLSYRSNNHITVNGRLDLEIAGTGKISGIKLQANEINIKANNLIVESLQDVLRERMRGAEINLGTNEKVVDSLGVKGNMQNRDAQWTKAIGSIIGTQILNILVQQTLEITGGLIANAAINEDGSLTDESRASIQAAQVIAKQLYDYDNGYTYGLGVTLNRKVIGADRGDRNGDQKDSQNNGNEAGKLKYGVDMPVVVKFSEARRDILPTIGGGSLTSVGGNDGDNPPTHRVIQSGNIGSSAVTVGSNDSLLISGNLNREVNSYIGATTTKRANLDSSIPVSDVADFIKAQFKRVNSVIDPEENDLEAEDDNANPEELNSTDREDILDTELDDYLNDDSNKKNKGDQEKNNKKSNQQNQYEKSQEKIAKVLNPKVNQDNFNREERKAYLDIREEIIEVAYDNNIKLEAAELKQITDKAYNLYQYYRAHPDKAPPMQLASIALITRGITYGGHLVNIVGTAILTYSGYEVSKFANKTENQIINSLALSILDPAEAESFIRDIDPEANKPKINSTPAKEDEPQIWSTPAITDEQKELSRLPGLLQTENNKVEIESFPSGHELIDSMNIFYKKQYPTKQVDQAVDSVKIKQYAVENSWSELSDLVKHVPEGYEFTKFTKGDNTIGIILKKGTHNEIAIKKAKSNPKFPTQEKDYVTWRINGNEHCANNGDLIYKDNYNILRKDGKTGRITTISNLTNPANHPDVHIPIEDWIKLTQKWK